MGRIWVVLGEKDKGRKCGRDQPDGLLLGASSSQDKEETKEAVLLLKADLRLTLDSGVGSEDKIEGANWSTVWV